MSDWPSSEACSSWFIEERLFSRIADTLRIFSVICSIEAEDSVTLEAWVSIFSFSFCIFLTIWLTTERASSTPAAWSCIWPWIASILEVISRTAWEVWLIDSLSSFPISSISSLEIFTSLMETESLSIVLLKLSHIAPISLFCLACKRTVISPSPSLIFWRASTVVLRGLVMPVTTA